MCFELTWAVFHEKGKHCRTSQILKSRDSDKEYAAIVCDRQLNENLEIFIDEFWSTDYFFVTPFNDSHYNYLWGTSKGYIQMALLCYISYLNTDIPKFSIYDYTIELFHIIEQNSPELFKFSDLFSIIT